MDTREADLRAPTHPVTPTDLHAPVHPAAPTTHAAPAAAAPTHPPAPHAAPANGSRAGPPGSPGSAPQRPPPSTPRSLPERIADAERAVIDHDEALRHGVDHLRAEAQLAVRRHMRAAAGAGAGAAVLGLLWWRSRHRPHRHAPVSAIGPYAEARRPIPPPRPSVLARLVAALVPLSMPVVTPIVTQRLRHAIGVRATSLVMAVALPALTRAAHALGSSPPAPAPQGSGTDGGLGPPKTVPLLDLQRYSGDWYEVARLPTPHERDCARDAATRYALQGDSLVVTQRCVLQDGTEESITGVAQQPDPARPGRLRLSFAPALLRTLAPFTWADYWVLHVDDDYSHALVGTPERDHLWLLSRTPRVDDTSFHRLASLAAAQGYPVHRLVRTPQTRA